MFFDRFHRHACGHHEHGLHGYHHHYDPRMAMFNPFDDEDETCFHMAGRHHGGPFGAGRGGRVTSLAMVDARRSYAAVSSAPMNCNYCCLPSWRRMPAMVMS